MEDKSGFMLIGPVASKKLIAKSKAFTLLEILVAVIIMGVVGSLALSKYSFIVEKQRAENAKQALLALFAEARRQAVENKGLPYYTLPFGSPGGPVPNGIPVEGFSGPTGLASDCTVIPTIPCTIFSISYVRQSSPAYVLFLTQPFSSGSIVGMSVNGSYLPNIVCTSTNSGYCAKLGF